MSNVEVSKWRDWMKQHADHAVDFAADRDDLLPGVVHAFSEIYLGLKSLPRFMGAKPRTASSTQHVFKERT
jgi:D-aspartate ligase